MTFRPTLSLWLTSFAIVAWAQTPTPPVSSKSGLSTDLTGAFVAQAEKPYVYTPLDSEFWRKMMDFQAEKNSIGMITEAARHADLYGDTADGAEGRLALALGLRAHGLRYAAYLALSDLAKNRVGSAASQAALHELSLLSLESNYDAQGLETLLNSNEFGPLHPETQSFVSMHRYLYDLRFGFNRWAANEKALIKPDSVWDWELKYWQAVGDVARDRLDKAESGFLAVKDSPKASTRAKQWATVQLARIFFERGQFEKAHELYTAIGDLGVREKGRLLLEVAWTKYYLKNYDKALGLLMALRAPYFLPSLTPERFILEVVIYRDLCHYEAVETTAKRFKESFNDAFVSIRKRRPLRDNRQLVSLALLDRDLQDKANLIDALREERATLAKYGWQEFNFYRPTLEAYSRRDRTLQRELDMILEPRVREIAEQLLDAEEQMQFLDYTSKLDALRIVRAGEERDYKSQEISYLTFDQIFWPVDNEFWWDEFDDYKTLISSRCNLAVNPVDEKTEREFE